MEDRGRAEKKEGRRKGTGRSGRGQWEGRGKAERKQNRRRAGGGRKKGR